MDALTLPPAPYTFPKCTDLIVAMATARDFHISFVPAYRRAHAGAGLQSGRAGRFPDAAQRAASTPASFPDVQLHIVDAPPTSGLPVFGNIVVQVGNSRLGCAGPESILPVVVMDSRLAQERAHDVQLHIGE
jgi:hypothetical protein